MRRLFHFAFALTAGVRAVAAGLCVAVLLAGAMATHEVAAQEVAAPGNPAEVRRAALFQVMLNDPSNLDVAFEYAMLSAEVGDFEGAIATLERMLIFAPNLPRVQLELGVLYYRIGARETARHYLEAATSRPDVPPAVRQRVNTFLAELDRQDRRLSVTGAIFAGTRYQTNANTSPDDAVISISGIPVTLDADARAKADASIFGLANLHFAYDLRNQGDLFEVDVTTYNQVYREITRLNLNLVESTIGPSFSLGRIGLDRARIGTYAILGATALDTEIYNTAWGGGLRFQARLHERVLWDSRHEVRSVNYQNSPNYPTVRLQTGVEYFNAVRLTTYLSPRISVEGLADLRRRDARADFEKVTEVGFAGRGTYQFYVGGLGGWFADDAPWSAALSAGLLLRRYDAPDPVINPVDAQETDAVWVEGGLSAPLKNKFALFGTAQLRVQDSNYPTREFTNATFTLGLSKRF